MPVALPLTTRLLPVLCGSLLVAAQPTFAQSTDFSRPSPITTLPIVGEFDGAQSTANYYSFEAGPGSILVTVDGHATRYSTTMQVKVSDANRNELGGVNLVAKTSPSSETTRINLSRRQKLVLETRLNEDTSMGVLKYSINMSGPIAITKAAPPAMAPTATSPAEARLAVGRTSSKFLRIEMRDGSTHNFDMQNVRRFVVE